MHEHLLMPTEAQHERPPTPHLEHGNSQPAAKDGLQALANRILANQEPGVPAPANGNDHEGFRDFAESLVQHIDEVFFWRDPECLRPYYVSLAYERIWGQSCESAYADPSSWIESIHPDDRERVLREFANAGSSLTQVEYRIIRPDGGMRWIWARMFPVQAGAGTPARLIGIAQDCTERKQSERMQAFLASIVESSDDSIVGTDLDGKIMSWNQGAEKQFGYTAEEALGKLITIMFPADRQAEFLPV